MKIRYGSLDQVKRAGTLVCFIVHNGKVPAVGRMWHDGKDFADVVARAHNEGFSGKDGQVWMGAGGEGLPARILLVGCGSRNNARFERVRRAAGYLMRKLKDFQGGAIDVVTPRAMSGMEDSAHAVRAVAEGMLLARYTFTRHKSKPAPLGGPTEARIFSAGEIPNALGAEEVARAEAYAAATNLTRDLVNEPPGVLTPRALAAVAKSLAKRPGVTCKVYDKAAITRMKMGALLGVNQGSTEPPVFIHLHYRPKGKPRRRIALVGKGITFDSGGLCLKPADGMVTMKDDMGGAATVLGVFHALSTLKLPIEVHGIVPSTDNMTGGNAYKPGDVLRAMNGKTIEVTNTDAEGRLILADALSYASRLEVDAILDFATLTGAIVVALGNHITGLFTNSQDLVHRLQVASERAGEHLWRMPIYEGYRENLRSHVADMVNSEKRDGSAIKAALFLSEFVAHDQWAHLDIAGTAWTDREQPYGPIGGTGNPVRTVLHYLSAL